MQRITEYLINRTTKEKNTTLYNLTEVPFTDFIDNAENYNIDTDFLFYTKEFNFTVKLANHYYLFFKFIPDPEKRNLDQIFILLKDIDKYPTDKEWNTNSGLIYSPNNESKENKIEYFYKMLSIAKEAIIHNSKN